jgi:hypothetical protein
LVGEDGTTYDANHIDSEYAKVDGEGNIAGYLTHINNQDKEVLINAKSLYRIAKAIRNKLNTTDKYLPSEMVNAINNINA